MGYVVTAPLVQALRQDGSYVHVYEGGLLPDDVDEGHRAHLVESGMVSGEPDAGKPAGNASVGTWRAYAVTQGMSDEEAAALDRDELRNLYG